MYKKIKLQNDTNLCDVNISVAMSNRLITCVQIYSVLYYYYFCRYLCLMLARKHGNLMTGPK